MFLAQSRDRVYDECDPEFLTSITPLGSITLGDPASLPLGLHQG